MHRAGYSMLEGGEINLTLRALRHLRSGLGVKVWKS